MIMPKWISVLIAKIKYILSTDWCYDRMEAEGHAANGRCCGSAGGTRHTYYLSEMCIECPYFDWPRFIKSIYKER